MTWQEPIVAIVVILAVVSLYRHVRGMLGLAKREAQSSCHGCDDCQTEPDAAGKTGTRERRS